LIGGGGMTGTDEVEVDYVALEGEVPVGLRPAGAVGKEVRSREEEERPTEESRLGGLHGELGGEPTVVSGAGAHA
jgi:hypothetical protein